MTSGKFIRRPIRLATLLTYLSIAMGAQAADLDATELISKLARPAPAKIAFKEIRFSSLLDQPSIVSGELGYLGPDSLDRSVTDPYRENTLIRGESVRVERDGEKTRTFALKRAPELRGLLTAFSAMLAGDVAAVEREFELTSNGEVDDWELIMAPRDARARKRLQQLKMNGHGDQPSCFSLTSADGTQSIMLLGERAAQPLDGITAPEQVIDRCKARALPK
jgi:hypothetical protein